MRVAGRGGKATAGSAGQDGLGGEWSAVENQEIGRQLRARRTAAGRTVASVAADAGLSVPYIANLENGRGNPTTAALARLANALGLRLVVTLDDGEAAPAPGAPEIPASLVRLGRSPRFRRAVAVMATPLSAEADELAVRLVAALAAVGAAVGRDLAEADWWRLLDALTLVAAHPAGPPAADPPPTGPPAWGPARSLPAWGPARSLPGARRGPYLGPGEDRTGLRADEVHRPGARRGAYRPADRRGAY